MQSQVKSPHTNLHSANLAGAFVCKGGNLVWAPQSSCWKWRGYGERPRPRENKEKKLYHQSLLIDQIKKTEAQKRNSTQCLPNIVLKSVMQTQVCLHIAIVLFTLNSVP